MTDRPIIFSAPMVRALLDGRKTQTRRLLPKTHPRFPHHNQIRMDVLTYDPQRPEVWYWDGKHDRVGASYMPPYAPGDRLWIKETWRPSISAADPWHVAVLYPHDGQVKHWNWSSDADFGDWSIPKAAAKGNVTPLFMPRWASRLTLTVTDVRVQRLQEISSKDVLAEGVDPDHSALRSIPRSASEKRKRDMYHDAHLSPFRTLWNNLYGPDAWDANPWVVAISFTVQHGNIDQIGGAS